MYPRSHESWLGEDAVVGGAVAGQLLYGVGVFVAGCRFFCSDPLQSNLVWHNFVVLRVATCSLNVLRLAAIVPNDFSF
jgi:hypothetical protein